MTQFNHIEMTRHDHAGKAQSRRPAAKTRHSSLNTKHSPTAALAALLLAVTPAVSCTEQFTGERQDFNDGWRFAICSGTALLETPVSVFDETQFPDGGPVLEVPYGCHLPEPSDGESLLARSAGPEDSDSLSEAGFDDSAWREVRLPHDWAVEGDFNRLNPSGTGGGALPEIGRAHV